MKKLYRKSTVHPSPPITSDHLSFLPVAILTLAAALSPEDKEVLAYLLSCSSSSSSSDNYTTTKKYKSPPSSSSSSNGTVLLNHTSPLFNCSCFGCYMSYWVRWDSSPNRQLIHEIIDAYEEDELLLNNNNNKNNDKKNKTKSKKDRKNNKGGSRNKASSSTVVAELGTELTRGKVELGTTESGSVDRVIIGGGGDGVEEVNNKGGSSSSSSSSVRSFMGFVGEKIWGVIWN